MISIITPNEMVKHLALRAKFKRLSLNMSQKTLSERSGVSYGVLKKFEQTGQISLKSLLKIALSLGTLEDFYDLFAFKKPEEAISFDDLLKDNSRKRGRK